MQYFSNNHKNYSMEPLATNNYNKSKYNGVSKIYKPFIIPSTFSTDIKLKKHNELVRWLKDSCNETGDIFVDPGYSDIYKSMYNIMDDTYLIYENNDIDHEINIGYEDYTDDNTKYLCNVQLEQYIDYVPKHINETTLNTLIFNKSFIEAENIKLKERRHNIVIPPGSNQSNANYLYKRIIYNFKHSQNVKYNGYRYTYSIPQVNLNPRVPYGGTYKNVGILLNKEQFYFFLKQNSRQKKIH